MSPDHEQTLHAGAPYDVLATLRWLPLGHRDPTWRRNPGEAVHACRTPDGPVTARFQPRRDGVKVQLWGEGTSFASARLASWVGLEDDPSTFRPTHPWVAEQARRFASIRHPTVVDPVQALWIVILQQRVTYADAHRAWFGMCRAWGESAPGPFPGLRVAPRPEVVARQPYEAFHPFGVERKRALTLKEAGAHADRVRAGADGDPVALRGQLARVPGIGPWTLGMLFGQYLGDVDAVAVRDVHLPHTVSWALQRTPRSNDAEMLRLLAPFRPHRARVIRYLLEAGVKAPKRGEKRRRGVMDDG